MGVSRSAAWTTCRMGGARSSKKKHFLCKKKTFLKVLRQPKWTPEAGLKPEKSFFLHRKGFFLPQCVPGWLQPQADPSRGLQLGPRAGWGVQEVVKKNLFCVKKNLFEGPQTA